MTPISHPWFPLREFPGSVPHSLLVAPASSAAGCLGQATCAVQGAVFFASSKASGCRRSDATATEPGRTRDRTDEEALV